MLGTYAESTYPAVEGGEDAAVADDGTVPALRSGLSASHR